jgi:Raf kinase inhibitor-like YbhB/YbcL family protein
MYSRLDTIEVRVSGIADGYLSLRHVAEAVGGDDIAPTVSWEPVEGAASYAVTCFDPDAPTGSGVWHWVITDIPATVTRISGGVPEVVGRAFVNDLGVAGYAGAAPPPGAPHHYEFKVWALDIAELPLPEGATNALARFFVHQHAIAAGTEVALFGVEAA